MLLKWLAVGTHWSEMYLLLEEQLNESLTPLWIVQVRQAQSGLGTLGISILHSQVSQLQSS